jgi:hypothetical protein
MEEILQIERLVVVKLRGVRFNVKVAPVKLRGREADGYFANAHSGPEHQPAIVPFFAEGPTV